MNAGDVHLNVNHVVNNHWDRWHGHGWDNGWYHGNWHGHWDNYWHAGWSNWWANPWYARAAFWGVTGWWLGSAVYDWGYVPYYNPYYTQSYNFGPTTIDYEQPVQVVDYGDQSDGANVPAVSPEATQHADAARQAFYDQNYRRAKSEIDQALGLMPGDPAFHELRALVLFAMGEYRAAAAAVHSLLAVGPGWDWTTMIGLYANEDIYTKQLRALEVFRRDHPNDAAARFLLAYHYLTMGHTPAAATELKAVVQLQPQDRVAAQLLQMITSAPNQEGQAGPPTAPDESTPPAEVNNGPPIDAQSLYGTWTARREDGSTIQLNLTPDARFTWRFSQGERVAPIQRHGHGGQQPLGASTGERRIDGRAGGPVERTRFPLLPGGRPAERSGTELHPVSREAGNPAYRGDFARIFAVFARRRFWRALFVTDCCSMGFAQ